MKLSLKIAILGIALFPLGIYGADSPNILLITYDNVGYGDLQLYNPESTVRTPNLDRFAAQGARLTQFYTASPTCTVSRACLLTGRIPQRHGLINQLPGIEGNYGVGLDQSEILIPTMMKRAATPYATGCFGKWNIGFAEGSRPTERGFDEFLGHASGNIDYYHHRYGGKRDLFEGTEQIIRDGEYASDLFADAAIDFIERRSASDEPWFCYLPFNAPHFPSKKNKLPGQATEWQAPDSAFAALGMSPDEPDPKKRYDAVMWALDEALGRVLASLDEAGVTDNTFVFLMSDNGAFDLNREGLDVGSNEPLRSGGVTCWDGGLRVPAFVRWPGIIEADLVIDEPLWSPDVLITCAELAEIRVLPEKDLDGQSMLPVLTTGAKSPHDSFYFEFRNHAALREGDWKIVREKPGNPWQLFNLGIDPVESNDLAAAKPKMVDELKSEFDRWRATF